MKVKTWIVKTSYGNKFEVFAPTKLLARLNFTHDYGWLFGACIESISVKRTKKLLK